MRFKYLSIAAISAVMCLPFIGCSGVSSSPDLAPHLISEPDTDPVRPITDRSGRELSEYSGTLTDAQYRARVDELYSIVVYDGLQPIFYNDDDPVKPVYDAAIAMLDRYVLNLWHESADGEYNIVHTIHDWLIVNTDYDFALYDSYNSGNTDLSSDPAFYMDGVFLNGRAVCDGLSRAFNFLCAIEGIESVRVTGSYSSSPHAWNKCKVGGKWYNVDVTSDCAYYTVGNGGYNKQLTHGFFMLSDSTLASFKPNGHVFETQPFVAEDDFDYYSGATIKVGGKEYPSVIKSQSELNRLFSAISDQNGRVGKIEVRLDFAGKTQVNSADMYTAEIAAAYSKLDNAGFEFSEKSTPYFRYPNGVYLFLLYR